MRHFSGGSVAGAVAGVSSSRELMRNNYCQSVVDIGHTLLYYYPRNTTLLQSLNNLTMLGFVENLLAEGSTMAVLLSIFVASQGWILMTLGETSTDLLQLQTVCMANPSPNRTGEIARKILETWTTADIKRFRSHYLLDMWIHPVIYALLFISAVFFDLKTHQTNDKKYDATAAFHGRVIAILIALGATCDILENQRHSSIEFEPALVASDILLWEACIFASTKWVIMNTVASWLFWRFVYAPDANQDPRHISRSKASFVDPEWFGPQPEDHLNTPCEAVGLLNVQGRKIPWTMTASGTYSDAERSYVVSPYGHYIGYGVDEVKLHSSNAPVTQFLALAVVRLLGLFFQLFSIDNCVYFNNLLLSTNLWPNTINWSQKQVESINQDLLSKSTKNSSKSRAIVWRSVDPLSQPNLHKVLSETESCMMLPARIVNYSDYSGKNFDKNELYQKNNFKRDIKMFKKMVGWDVVHQKHEEDCEGTKYEMATIPANELTREEAGRIIGLFNQLYLVKYSRRNPQLTLEGLMRMAKTGFLTVDVLRERKRGHIVAFSTGSTTDGVRTPSFIGYDVKNDKEKIYYRLVMIMIHCNLIRDGVEICHHSGGANEFKRHRGATSTVEYSAVFIDHLPFYRQLPWKVAKVMAERIIRVKNAY